jgi:hypothetical protein
VALPWVNELVECLEEFERRDSLALKRIEMAEAAAPHFFSVLARCMEAGVRELVQEKPYLHLIFRGVPSDRFTVSRDEFPCVTLDVERKGIRLEIRHSFRADEATERSIEEKIALLKSASDGSLLAKCDSRLFTEATDFSQALLRPIVRFIGSNL